MRVFLSYIYILRNIEGHFYLFASLDGNIDNVLVFWRRNYQFIIVKSLKRYCQLDSSLKRVCRLYPYKKYNNFIVFQIVKQYIEIAILSSKFPIIKS